jgi:ABC-type spermidine/putrescine transport system permease subunit II
VVLATEHSSGVVLILLVVAVIAMVAGGVAVVGLGRRNLRGRGGLQAGVALVAIVAGYVVIALALFDLLLAAGLRAHLDALFGR